LFTLTVVFCPCRAGLLVQESKHKIAIQNITNVRKLIADTLRRKYLIVYSNEYKYLMLCE
jgi:hypothetical protein